jgi:hypothetical protein
MTQGMTQPPAHGGGGGRTPRFSVVIPLHDKAAYIGCTLRSVLAQTFADLEVLVVDDGSRDAGPEIVQSFDDPRVRLVRQPNAGVSAARNTGIAMARGDWVAFLDADDWHHPEYLAALVRAQQAQPAAGAVATRFLSFGDEQGLPPPSWTAAPETAAVEVITDLPTRWRQGPCFFTGSIAVRRSLLQAMQPCFPPGESFAEDLDLWFRLAERTPIALVREALAAYRVDVQGCLSRGNGRSLPPFAYRLQQRARSGALTPAQSRSALRFVEHLQMDLARSAVASGRRGEGWLWLLRGVRGSESLRWWLTAFMALCWPAEMVEAYLEQPMLSRAPLQADPPQVDDPRGPLAAARPVH